MGDEGSGGDVHDALLAAAVAMLPSAVVVFDEAARPRWANAATHRLLTGDAAVRGDLAVAFSRSDVDGDEALDQALSEALEGTASRLEVTVRTNAGVVRSGAWTGPLPGPGGSGVHGAVLCLPADEERLHPLLANTYDIITVLAADGTIRYSNPAAGKLTSYEGTVLAGTSALDLVHPEDRERVLEVLDDPSHATDEPVRVRLRFGDGHWHHCLVHLADLVDDPTVGGIIVTVHDITDQVVTNQELRNSEQWVRRLLAQLTDVVVVFDESGEIIYVSPSIERLVGHPESVHPGTNAFEDVHPDDLGSVERVFDAVLAEPAVEHRTTFRLRHADGHYVWVEAVVTNGLTDPAVCGVIATLRDITQLKQAEEMFRGLVESAPDAMVVVDEDGVVVLANERAEGLFGWSAEELVGRGIEVLVPEAVHERHVSHRAEFYASPRRRTMGEGIELWARHRDGREIPVEVSLSPHHTHEGLLVSAAVRDITQQRETRRALESALEKEQQVVRRLEEADELKAEFVSTVAHELKSPLTAISGFATMLERLAPGESVGSMSPNEMAGRISANAHRLLEMIDQLLRFSRLEAGSARLDRQEVDLHRVVGRSVDLLGEGLAEHRVEVDVPEELTVWADEDGIANVLRNLLSNASKFGPPGTTIRVEATEADQGVQISVSDEGPGVDPEDRDGVFDQFRQTSTGQSRGGTGLGLSIARRYVELHGGRIWVDDGPGGGARFCFVLPFPSTSGSG